MGDDILKTVAFFDTKPYDRAGFERLDGGDIRLRFFENKLNADTVSMTACCDAVCVFVNDTLDRAVIDALCGYGIGVAALRCAGYNNVDLRAAKGRLTLLRVPGYSPYSVAEHTMGLILTLDRRLHRAYLRTRDHNFSLDGLTGFDLHGKTVGVIGTGRIGCCFAAICQGFGMRVIGFDPYPNPDFPGESVLLDTLLQQSDVISLHCPLTRENRHLICRETIGKMKKGVFIINTSRGKLIDTAALIDGIKAGVIGAAGLDVYEEETALFFEDYSGEVIHDDTLSALISQPNVLVTSHQAFLTREALAGIAETTMENLRAYFAGEKLVNEIVVNG